MFIIYIFDCLFISEWRISTRKKCMEIQAMKWYEHEELMHHGEVKSRQHNVCVCWTFDARLQQIRLKPFKGYRLTQKDTYWNGSSPFSLRWFRSIFSFISKRLDSFQLILLSLWTFFNYISYLFLWITALCNVVLLCSLFWLLWGFIETCRELNFPNCTLSVLYVSKQYIYLNYHLS